MLIFKKLYQQTKDVKKKHYKISRNVYFEGAFNLLTFSPQVKSLMILTHVNVSPELLINLITSKLKMRGEAHP